MIYIYNIIDNDQPSRKYPVKIPGDGEQKDQALSIGSSRLKTCNVRITSIKELKLL